MDRFVWCLVKALGLAIELGPAVDTAVGIEACIEGLPCPPPLPHPEIRVGSGAQAGRVDVGTVLLQK